MLTDGLIDRGIAEDCDFLLPLVGVRTAFDQIGIYVTRMGHQLVDPGGQVDQYFKEMLFTGIFSEKAREETMRRSCPPFLN